MINTVLVFSGGPVDGFTQLLGLSDPRGLFADERGGAVLLFPVLSRLDTRCLQLLLASFPQILTPPAAP